MRPCAFRNGYLTGKGAIFRFINTQGEAMMADIAFLLVGIAMLVLLGAYAKALSRLT